MLYILIDICVSIQHAFGTFFDLLGDTDHFGVIFGLFGILIH